MLRLRPSRVNNWETRAEMKTLSKAITAIMVNLPPLRSVLDLRMVHEDELVRQLTEQFGEDTAPSLGHVLYTMRVHNIYFQARDDDPEFSGYWGLKRDPAVGAWMSRFHANAAETAAATAAATPAAATTAAATTAAASTGANTAAASTAAASTGAATEAATTGLRNRGRRNKR